MAVTLPYGTNATELGDNERYAMRWSRRYVTTAFTVAGAVIFLAWATWTVYMFTGGPDYALPDLRNVTAISARFDGDGRKQSEFKVPQEHWDRIFSSLTPSEHDPAPAKWQVIGSLRVRSCDGSEYWIWLFDTHESRGAFSVGTSYKHRTYYRGGDSFQLEKALRAAYASVRQKER